MMKLKDASLLRLGFAYIVLYYDKYIVLYLLRVNIEKKGKIQKSEKNQ